MSNADERPNYDNWGFKLALTGWQSMPSNPIFAEEIVREAQPDFRWIHSFFT
jgi:hypothetical protein